MSHRSQISPDFQRQIRGNFHNYLHLVVLERCSLVVVMKFQNKFTSLRQLNSPIAEISFKYVVS